MVSDAGHMCLYWFRFTSIRGEKPIDTANCPFPRSYKKVQAVRAVFPARGWSCSPCCASKPVTTWPSSSMAAQIQPGSSSTAWPTVMVRMMACWCCFCKFWLKLLPFKNKQKQTNKKKTSSLFNVKTMIHNNLKTIYTNKQTIVC